ncbi:MAG: histidine phosphatase family protein [Nocardioides sp.]|uniref:histidine phosphatase family protein n=1 Tax=Nocardioides sp. TaxID=35761 RepID=UPI003EFBE91B
MRLLLMRHGQTHANVSGQLDTAHPGLDLTALGQRQATAAAQALGESSIESIYVSSRVRTHQTAAPSAQVRRYAPTEMAGLEEIQAGDFEMLNDAESIHGYIATVTSWISGDLAVRMPGGETGHQFLERYDAAIERIVQAGHDAAMVVSHGAAIRTWTAARMLAGSVIPNPTSPLHNTALIVLEGDHRSGWRLEEWHGEPYGGAFLDDSSALDPTAVADAGQAAEQAD